MNNHQFVSVSALNKYINYKFEQDINLQEVYLQGEISNFKYSGKHCYFSLKDSYSEISAMFFYPNNLNLNFKPTDGMSVQVVGKIQVYQKKGTYAILVNKMVQEGIGLLYQNFLDLKEKLFKEGLFDESKKLKLPEYPETVAVITAPTGEAIRDIVSTFNRRLPLATIKLYPALVQGMDAPKDLIRALKLVYKDNDADAIIIGRGGGSFEDLSCFNDEELARLLFSSTIPTISAVGHEGDYTICDFVASYRAPTPTGAAMKLTKDKDDVINILIESSKRVKNALRNRLKNDYERYIRFANSYAISNFDGILNKYQMKLDALNNKLFEFSPLEIIRKEENLINELQLKMTNQIKLKFENSNALFDNYNSRLRINLIEDLINKKEREINNCINLFDTSYQNIINSRQNLFNNLIDKIVLLNPFNIMEKGYGIIYKNNNIITSAKNLNRDDEILIQLSDGKVSAKVK